eukprot:7810709-Lingulodinium_polyedra.AAC.1
MGGGADGRAAVRARCHEHAPVPHRAEGWEPAVREQSVRAAPRCTAGWTCAAQRPALPTHGRQH